MTLAMKCLEVCPDPIPCTLPTPFPSPDVPGGGGTPTPQSPQVFYSTEYSARTNATSGDPLTARVMWNNVAPGSATQIYISKTNAKGTDISGVAKSITAGRVLEIYREQDSSMYARYVVNSVTDSGTYFTIAVTPLDYANMPFINNYDLTVVVK